MAGSTYPGGSYPGEYYAETAGYLTPAPFRITVTVPSIAGLPTFGSSPLLIPSASAMGAGPVPTTPPVFHLATLGGVSGPIRPNTLSILDAVGQVQTMDCEVEDRHGARMFNVNSAFHVQDNVTTIFYGDLDEIEIASFESPYDLDTTGRHVGVVGARYFRLRGSGLSHLATRLLTGAFSAQARVAISTVVAAVSAPLGLAQVISTAGSLSLPDSFISEQETIADALTRLADLATGLSGVVHYWVIDYPGTSFSTPTLYFTPITGRVASSALGGASGYPIKSGSIRVRVTREQFKNSAVLKLDRYLKDGGGEQTDTKAGSDIFLGTLALTSPLAGQPTVTVEGIEETVGIKDSDTGKDWYWSLGSNILKVGASTASGSDVIVVTYAAHDLRSVTVTDAASVSANGLFQLAAQTPDTGNNANPASQAALELARHNGFTTEVRLIARTPSGAFKAGELIPTILTGFGSLGVVRLAGYFYCKSIRTYDEDLTTLWREFQLLSGPMLFSAPAYFKRLTR